MLFDDWSSHTQFIEDKQRKRRSLLRNAEKQNSLLGILYSTVLRKCIRQKTESMTVQETKKWHKALESKNIRRIPELERSYEISYSMV